MVWRASLGVATKNPGKNYGTFFTSLLRVTAGFVTKERSLVDAMSHTREVRNILLKHGIKCSRQSKITLGYGPDPECHLKKKEN